MSKDLMKSAGETRRPTLVKDTAFFVGASKRQERQATPEVGPGMEAGNTSEAECLTFRTCRGDDTLDAFGPLAKYAPRPQADNQTAHQAIVSSFAAPVGEITYIRTGVPGPMGLMKVKSKDLEVRAEQLALDMRKSKRK